MIFKEKKFLYPFITIALIFFSYYFYIWTKTESTDNAYLEGDISFVSSEVPGVIKEVYVKDNQKVQKNEILAKIDDTEYLLNLEISQNKYEFSEKSLEISKKKYEISEINKKQAEENYNFTLKNFENKASDLERAKNLIKVNFSSKKILDDANLAFEKAKSDMLLAKKELDIANLNLEMNEISLNLENINFNNAKKALDIAKYKFDKTIITSPVDGIVANNNLRIGRFLNPGMSAVSVVSLDGYYLKANFKETQIANLKPFMIAKIKFDGIAQEFNGKIRGIYPATGAKFSLIPPDNATGNFTKIVQKIPVIIDLELDDELKEKLKIGMSSHVKIRIDQ